MMSHVFKDRLGSCCFWSLPVGLLFIYGNTWRDNVPIVDEGKPRSYDWLILPAETASEYSWSAVLGTLDIEEPAVEPRPGAALPVVPDPAFAKHKDADEPFRIRLAGRIRDGSEDLYCLFDTNERRWFRMSGDSVDAQAGVSLEVNHDTGNLVITNLLDGTRYMANAGAIDFERIEPAESTRLEGLE